MAWFCVGDSCAGIIPTAAVGVRVKYGDRCIGTAWVCMELFCMVSVRLELTFSPLSSNPVAPPSWLRELANIDAMAQRNE